MKTSVSIPDDLWTAARSHLHEHTSPSAIVQEALRRVTAAGSDRPGYAEPVDDEATRAVKAAIRERLTAEAREDYQAGYREGIELAQRLTWREIDYLLPAGGDVMTQVEANRDLAERIRVETEPADRRPVIDPELLGTYFGAKGHPLVDWSPSTITIKGLCDALISIRALVDGSTNTAHETPTEAPIRQ